MFGKKKTTETKTLSTRNSSKKPYAKKPRGEVSPSLQTPRPSSRPAVSSATPSNGGHPRNAPAPTNSDFLYISNEFHYEQVIERIKNVKKTLWMRLRASTNVKNFLSCKRTKSVLALPISKTCM